MITTVECDKCHTREEVEHEPPITAKKVNESFIAVARCSLCVALHGLPTSTKPTILGLGRTARRHPT
jgi:hypothetical protein